MAPLSNQTLINENRRMAHHISDLEDRIATLELEESQHDAIVKDEELMYEQKCREQDFVLEKLSSMKNEAAKAADKGNWNMQVRAHTLQDAMDLFREAEEHVNNT